MVYLNLNRTVKLQQWGKHFGREHLCKIILNLGQWVRKRSRLNFTLPLALVATLFSGAKHFLCNFERGPDCKHLCEFILHLDQQLR